MDARGTVTDLLDVLAAGRELDDGDEVDVLTHALQCAALLAAAAPDDEELQVAGLVHDIGTVLAPGHPASHAATGATAVAGTFGARVGRLVAWHADAKRYLVATDPAYARRLSARSAVTLDDQGGPLDGAAVAAWRRRPGWDDALTLRQADDAAKDPRRAVADLATWVPVCGRVAAGAERRGAGPGWSGEEPRTS